MMIDFDRIEEHHGPRAAQRARSAIGSNDEIIEAIELGFITTNDVLMALNQSSNDAELAQALRDIPAAR